MNFDKSISKNDEEDRLVNGLSYESVLKSTEILSKEDRLKLSMYLLEESIHDLYEEQWKSLISYLKQRKGIRSDDRIEQKRLDETYSRVIVSANYEDYTPREIIVEYLSRYFDWQAEELDASSTTTVFFSNLWQDFVKHVQTKTGWNRRKVVKMVRKDYFKKYLTNYGSYSLRTIVKDEDLHQDWLIRATLLARKENISRKDARKLLFKRDPNGYKRANAKTTRTIIEGLPALRKEWQVCPPSFVFEK